MVDAALPREVLPVVSVRIIYGACPVTTHLIMQVDVNNNNNNNHHHYHHNNNNNSNNNNKNTAAALEARNLKTAYQVYRRQLLLQMFYCCIIDCSRTQHAVDEIPIATITIVKDCCCAID